MVRDRYDDIMDALPLMPRQERARATVRRLLLVSEAYIESGNIDRLTTAGVAKQAGVSIGTLYRYFADRVAILDALRPERHTEAARLRESLVDIAKHFEDMADSLDDSITHEQVHEQLLIGMRRARRYAEEAR